MPKFKENERVVFTDRPNKQVPNWSHMASMGNEGYMILNAKDEGGRIKPLTGTILKVIQEPDGSTTYDFAPDGWKTPPSGWPRGFRAEEKYLSKCPPELHLPGTIK